MSPTLANFLFEAANFLLLAAVLGWVLFAPVRRALDAEREHHTKERAEAERLRHEADSLLAQARASLENAERDRDALRREIIRTAEEKASRILEEARKAQRAERAALERELATTRDTEAYALADTIGRIAAESVRRLLDALDGPSLDAALARSACAELERLPGAARRPAVVESARTLSPTVKDQLAGVLGAGFEERVVGEHGAGVCVITPAGKIDATAASLARRAARAIAVVAAAPDAPSEAAPQSPSKVTAEPGGD